MENVDSAAAFKIFIAQQRGKRRHSGASWKRLSWHSSLNKVGIAQQC